MLYIDYAVNFVKIIKIGYNKLNNKKKIKQTIKK